MVIMNNPAMQTALNAMANSSRTPVSEEILLQIVRTGDGPGHLVRALFGDCSAITLDRLGIALGLPLSHVRDAYSVAKRLHNASNSELDDRSLDPY